MDKYLSQGFDLNDDRYLAVYDELPLWSAPFGMMLLDRVQLRPNITALDIGSGAGFPLLELAQRLGDSCRVYGIDPWEPGLNEINLKIKILELKNISAIKGVAEHLPFENSSFDLIISNNGINNVRDQEKALTECFRVSRPAAQMVITLNLPETMKEFYEVFESTLRGLGKDLEIKRMHEHIFHKRKPLSWTKALLQKAGFRIVETKVDSFKLRYLDGRTMFKHFLIQSSFLDPWKKVIAPEDISRVFGLLEEDLNRIAWEKEELSLTIPMVCIACRKD
jgi:ubiquinone/menaquinone biosynthesis C-methylase UbiE